MRSYLAHWANAAFPVEIKERVCDQSYPQRSNSYTKLQNIQHYNSIQLRSKQGKGNSNPDSAFNTSKFF